MDQIALVSIVTWHFTWHLTMSRSRSPPAPGDRKPKAFLVFHGSFNPLHLGHVETMRQARLRVEVEGYHVIRGVVAMTDTGYVKHKKGQCLKDQHRVQALLRGFQDLAWVQVNTQYPRFSSGRHMSRQLWKEFARELSQPQGEKWAVFCVCGDDVVERYETVDDWSVVVGRNGAPARIDEIIQKKRSESRGRGGKILRAALNDEYANMSSTEVRAALNARSREKLDQMCSADVASYLWDIPETELYVDS